MSSGYPGDQFIRGGGAVRPPTIGGNQLPGFRQQQQQQQQGGMMMLQDQIEQRRADLLMGKRSFGDYQSYQQLLNLQQRQMQQQQQQQQQPVSYLQLQQQLQQRQRQQQQSAQQHMSMLLRNQSLMRSVKQRTPPVDLSSLTNNNNNNNMNIINNINMLNHNNYSNNNSLTRFGVPVYQQQIPFINNNNNQLNQTSYTQLIPFNNNNTNNNQRNPTNFPISSNNSNSQVINPVQAGVLVPPVQPDNEVKKILSTLQELEKQLLDDDDDNDEYSVSNTLENDAVSGITNSEWSETFQSLMSPNPRPSPTPLPANINVVSPSPTSSTSSCCSTSAPATTVSPKQLIADVATAISDGKNDLAAEMLAKLSLVSNCDGSSEQRLAYYMSHALRCRVENVHAPPVAELFGGDQVSSVYSLYDISPCFKFGLLAANLVMLEAITGAIHEGLKIHIIDFDVGHGAQYVNLLRALAERRTRIPCLGMKITIVETGLGGEGGVETGGVKDALVGLADRLGVSLKYECVTRAIHELTRESLGCEEGEAVVVNFAFKLYRVPDESVSVDNLRDELLRRVKGLSPRAVTLVEQDMNGNGAPFMTRVSEVCEYYGALFDSLEATLGRDNVDRCRVEKGLGRKMVNSVACEGKERVERAEVFGKWRARMGMAGFELKALSHTVAESMRAKLDSARGGNPGFTVKEENGGVGFGWMGRNLTVASAWR